MKLTFKDLKQVKFVIEAEPSDTIGALKEKIHKEKGWEPSSQKLIYSGKILKEDSETVESYKIEEKGFIVCMVSKPRAAPAAAATSSTSIQPTPASPATAPTTSTPAAAAAPAPAAVSTPPAGAPAASPAPATAPADVTGGLLMGTQREAAIGNLMEMGFARPEVEAAMRAAFNSAERAVEYLMTGIPEHLRQQSPAPAGGAAPPSGGAPAAAPVTSGGDGSNEGGEENINLFEAAARAAAQGGSGAGAGAGTGATAGTGGTGTVGEGIEFLRNNPQFQQLRQIVQSQPQMLEPILQQVSAGNPGLAQLIQTNPRSFINLLSEGAGDEGGEALPPGATQIQVTEEEAAAIDRLVQLGFNRTMAIQAYFACEKNEELAANYLFDNQDDDFGAA